MALEIGQLVGQSGPLGDGDVFAEIIPSGRGFQIRSGESTVRVKGTKFGVSSPSTV